MSVTRHLRVLDCRPDGGSGNVSIKVAFATVSLSEVDQHFGAAESFAIHSVDLDGSRLDEVVQFGRQEMDGVEDKLAAKIEALEGCVAVYCSAVGGSAIMQLKSAGVQPVKVSAGSRVADLIRDLQDELRAGPGTWLARAISRLDPASPDRFERMEAEGWDE